MDPVWVRHTSLEIASSVCGNPHNEVGDRTSQYFASVKIASDIVTKVLGIGDQKTNEEALYNLFKNYIADFYNKLLYRLKGVFYIMS